MRRDLVVIGASAGGVEALKSLVGWLPADLHASVLVVLHVPPRAESVLPRILTRFGSIPARHAHNLEGPAPGEILVGPPDHHLIVQENHIELTRGPRENGHRPSIDVLFRSAARWAGPRVISVVLSGVLDDGTAGAVAVRQQGGISIVQDPSDALFPGMPESCITHGAVDHIAATKDIAALLDELTRESVDDQDEPVSDRLQTETALARLEEQAMNEHQRPGSPSGFACPDCGGTLFTIRDGDLMRFRCRVGHAWSSDSLLGQQSEQLESALWMALRTLEEKAALAAELRLRALERNSDLVAERYRDQEAEATRAADLIRTLLSTSEGRTA